MTLKKRPQPQAMIKGHHDQTRQNIWSPKSTIEQDKMEEESYPVQLTLLSVVVKKYITIKPEIFPSHPAKGNFLIVVLHMYAFQVMLSSEICLPPSRLYCHRRSSIY